MTESGREPASIRFKDYARRPAAVHGARSAEGCVDRLPALTAEIVERKVDVLVTYGRSAGMAAKSATCKRVMLVRLHAIDIVNQGKDPDLHGAHFRGERVDRRLGRLEGEAPSKDGHLPRTVG